MSIDGEDVTRSRHGAYLWQASTLNHWTLEISGIHVASVVRPRSWKTKGMDRPWRVEVFGSPFVRGILNNAFRTLDQARVAAEKEMKRLIFEVAHELAE